MTRPRREIAVLAVDNPVSQDDYAELVNDTDVSVSSEQTFTTKEGSVLRVVDFDRREPPAKGTDLPSPPVC